MVYILVAILMFGVLIAVHEFGHFITAKLFGIRVNEFSIGMGPALFKREKGETLYSIRLLPIGGYCAMEGEDEESDDPRAFGNAAAWKKVIVLVAGAFMNFLTGLIIVLVLYAPAQGFYQEIYAGSMAGKRTEGCGLQEGDRFLQVDGHKVLTYGNAQFYMSRAGDTMDLVVERDGEKVYLYDVSLPRQERTDEEGNTTNYRGITIGAQVLPAGLGTKLIYSWNTTLDYVRLVWVSLGDLVRGAVGIKDLSGGHRGHHVSGGQPVGQRGCGHPESAVAGGADRGKPGGHEPAASACSGRRPGIFPAAQRSAVCPV